MEIYKIYKMKCVPMQKKRKKLKLKKQIMKKMICHKNVELSYTEISFSDFLCWKLLKTCQSEN